MMSAPMNSEGRGRDLLLRRFNAAECADIHCHCLPGLDDGPADVAAALELCRALVEDGITTAVATPHQLGRYDGRNKAAEVRRAVGELRGALAAEQIPLEVVAGGDVRVDERIARLVDADEVLTLGDTGRYILLELPHDMLVDPRDLLKDLTSSGRTPILSHPERQPQLCRQPDALLAWLEMGACLQVTAGSLVGDFGDEPKRAAWGWLKQGLVQLVASDAHDAARRPPRMIAAIEAIAVEMPHIVARRLCIENPLRVLRGEPLPSLAGRASTLRGGRGAGR